jgi:2-polyprenyl-3-methyl-5-hydroxy-6-metoxy-1,4-benzoquinol methylase
MSTALDLTRRSLEPELMDEPGVGRESLTRALRAIERLNRVSLAARRVWAPIARLARSRGAGRPLRVLDLASGGGYLAIEIARRAARDGLAVEVSGSDLNPTSVEFARSRARASGAAVDFFQVDCLSDELPAGYDVLTSTLFLHHLTQREAARALAAMGRAARRMVLVNDLVRCRAGYVLARVSTTLATRSPMVRFDGPRSVERAFTLGEARELVAQSGLEGARVTPAWPFRMLIEWERRDARDGEAAA